MKAAKGILILSLAMVLCLGVAGTGFAAGGKGYGRGGGGGAGLGSGTGIGAGTCINSNIATATPVEVSGTVANVCNYGQGIGIDTGEEIVQVYGIGPIRYWESVLDVARPDVGDTISVDAREVTFSDGTVKIIAFEITLDGEGTIGLRDLETGLPLWRGGFGGGRRLQTGECPYL